MTDISLTFPDGSKRPHRAGITGVELAGSISKSLAKKAVAMVVDGKLADQPDLLDVGEAWRYTSAGTSAGSSLVLSGANRNLVLIDGRRLVPKSGVERYEGVGLGPFSAVAVLLQTVVQSFGSILEFQSSLLGLPI